MILVVDYNVRELNIWAFGRGRHGASGAFFAKSAEELHDARALEKYVRSITGRNRLEAVAFRVLFGGDCFDRPAAVDRKFFERFRTLTDLFPLYVPSQLAMMEKFRDMFRGCPLTAFFETSFFTKLDDEEKYYALPFEYYKNSRIKKFGFHGIFHEANAGIVPPSHRTISLVFDKQTTVCAVRDRRPLSISLGYTPLEGIMAHRSSGDLDPGIVFYLMKAHNFSIYRIDEMLKNKSGFTGLTGYDVSLSDLIKLRGKDAKVDLAFDVYSAQIMKHIGEGIALLGGLDDIVIAGGYVDMLTPVIHHILKKISFLGITVGRVPWDKDADITDVTSEESKIKVSINRSGLPAIIARAARFLR
ncbi:MAG: hypothetical protein PHS37_06555 [Candidatus Omnitrophica bacterium]|nr:hypothetical protein [Candidatus Omnitrophota bacterium]